MPQLLGNKGKAVLRCYRAACEARDQNKFKKAIKLIDEAFSLFPTKTTNFKLLITKGDILESLKKYKEAEKVARKAIRVKPNHWAGWLLLGSINTNLKYYEKAAYCYKKVISKKPNFNFYTILANCELTFDPQAALRDAQAALKINPKWDEAIKVRDKAKQLLTQ